MPENIFRPQYRELKEEEKDLISTIKAQAFELLQSFDSTHVPISAGREMACAKTKLEECIMWAVKAVTK